MLLLTGISGAFRGWVSHSCRTLKNTLFPVSLLHQNELPSSSVTLSEDNDMQSRGEQIFKLIDIAIIRYFLIHGTTYSANYVLFYHLILKRRVQRWETDFNLEKKSSSSIGDTCMH